jgi:hypothetical protein
MVTLESVGEVIATRTLVLKEADGRSREITVLIGKPEQFPDGEDYYCPFQIKGLGDEKVRFAAGADAVQALQLAMPLVGSHLDVAQKKFPKHLTWFENEELGFPASKTKA